MTTVSPPLPAPEAQARRTSWGHWYAAVRHALDRPLTAYYLLLGASGLLLTIGLIMVLSASSVYSYEQNGSSYAVVTRQLMWVAIGLPCAWVASRLPTSFVRRFAWLGLILAVVLLALVRVPGLGREVNGNTNWLGLGPFVVQPAEVAKLAIVLWAAHIYARKDKRLGSFHEVLMPVVPGVLLVVGLVVLGKDLGTALVLAAILMAMLWVVGAPGRLFAAMLSGVAVLAFYLASTSSERLARLSNFADPFKDYLDTGWQPAHGLYALSSGGIFGEGIGSSRQKWGDLPEAHTDFIFAVLGEELGLIGTLLVVGLFLTIAYAAVRIATHTTEPFVRYMSFGIVVWLLGQMIINVGMVLALVPVIGIPLPLVSYGGSALVPSLVALGLLIGFARRDPEAAQALAQRKKARSAGLAAGRVS
ncbi:putative lipid II flippase FtsW [Nocardioides sp. MAH-18]|uniref:Probable peptidoglycan glycosyltransferase FtsW n=1 Tax=Nocardioides agri TaxID=2682843 RepID=A0A6L6XXQ8_9ACTN|nr:MULTISPECIES: putative lipid II flippase FtsW [unclassified Nocardioides]MBA2952315.1 putative lipid II flippase FtsW [Nocardioides sp. CGMCC 1.13656]MVQ51477.1 putative lipid II flippase FtsW [Nocardioides sp. MAH-18]